MKEGQYCPACNGRKVQVERVNLQVDVPRGAFSGWSLRYARQGFQHPTMRPGDVMVVVATADNETRTCTVLAPASGAEAPRACKFIRGSSNDPENVTVVVHVNASEPWVAVELPCIDGSVRRATLPSPAERRLQRIVGSARIETVVDACGFPRFWADWWESQAAWEAWTAGLLVAWTESCNATWPPTPGVDPVPANRTVGDRLVADRRTVVDDKSGLRGCIAAARRAWTCDGVPVDANQRFRDPALAVCDSGGPIGQWLRRTVDGQRYADPVVPFAWPLGVAKIVVVDDELEAMEAASSSAAGESDSGAGASG